MTSASVAATDTAIPSMTLYNMLLRELAKLELCCSYAILQQRSGCAGLAPHSCNIAYEQRSAKRLHGFLHRWQMNMLEQF